MNNILTTSLDLRLEFTEISPYFYFSYANLLNPNRRTFCVHQLQMREMRTHADQLFDSSRLSLERLLRTPTPPLKKWQHTLVLKAK